MRSIVAPVICLFLACCPSAVATSVHAPPGNSGVDEYFETVPGPGGNQAPGAGHQGGSRLPAAVRRQLEGRGAEGKAALKLAGTAAPRDFAHPYDRPKGDRSSRSRTPVETRTDDPDARRSSAATAIRQALGGTGG